MNPRLQTNRAWRWLPFTACLLVFLFAFHAKTAVYGPSLNVKPDAATASKLWVKDKTAPPRPAPIGLIPYSQLVSSQEPVSTHSAAPSRVTAGFAPLSSFSGLSPPVVI